MMQLTPQKIAAIKALADDVRGEPNTRRIAQEKLAQYRLEHPEAFSKPKSIKDILEEAFDRAEAETRGRQQQNPPNPRAKQRPDYAKWRFMDMDQWTRSKKGNHIIGVDQYSITIFRNKRGTWSWSRSDGDNVVFGHGFDGIRMAQESAWISLQNL